MYDLLHLSVQVLLLLASSVNSIAGSDLGALNLPTQCKPLLMSRASPEISASYVSNS
jgi:hypothetical protein